MATVELKCQTVSWHGHIELRRYAPVIVAGTFVEGNMDAASGKGFRVLAHAGIRGEGAAPTKSVSSFGAGKHP